MSDVSDVGNGGYADVEARGTYEISDFSLNFVVNLKLLLKKLGFKKEIEILQPNIVKGEKSYCRNVSGSLLI